MPAMATSTVSTMSSALVDDEMFTNALPAILLYNDAQRHKAETVVHRMVKKAVELEGTVTVSPFLPILCSLYRTLS